MEQAGVIGVGRMGLAIVKHLIRHGYTGTARDIASANLDKARALGARPAVDAAGLSLPLTGAVKELVKEARRTKAANPPQWTRGRT